jgi:hypothetical protein
VSHRPLPLGHRGIRFEGTAGGTNIGSTGKGSVLDTHSSYIPRKGERVEQTRGGVRRCGTVWYADGLQVLVKWDDGSSSSLRIGRDTFAINEPKERS